MSYDVSLMLNGGGTESAEVYWANHTSNTAIMWREAGCDIAEFHEAPASLFFPALALAVSDMEFRPGHYAQWNPPNGWGDVESTLGFLRGLRDACERFPLAKIRVSR